LIVARHIRLIRPMSRENIAKERMESSHWKEVDLTAFSSHWQDEVAAIPATTESTLHIVTGLLLPIWKHLPSTNMKVYRLQTDAGERIVGRLVLPQDLGRLHAAFNLDGAPVLSAAEAFDLVLDRCTSLPLRGDLTLRRSTVMYAPRIELSGFSDHAVPQLKALGLTSEIIAWKLRLFVPVGEAGIAILGRLFELHPPLQGDTGAASRASAENG